MEYVDSPVSKVFEAHIYSIKPLSMSFTSHLAVKSEKGIQLDSKHPILHRERR